MRYITTARLPVLLAFLGILLGGPLGAQAAGHNCGIQGQVFVYDPFAATINGPPGRAGVVAPFRASLRVYAAGSNRLVTTIRTDAAGRFRVPLHAGVYRVVPDTMFQGHVLRSDMVIGPVESAPAVTIRVRPHQFAPLTITYQRSMGM